MMDDKRLDEIRAYLRGWTASEYARLPYHYKVLHPKAVELVVEVERLRDELSTAKADLLEAGGEIQDLEFRLDAAVKEIQDARR